MIKFMYRAVDRQGKKLSGVMLADTPEEVARILREKMLYITTITVMPTTITTRFITKQELSCKRLALLFSQLAMVVESGIPLVSGLQIIREQLVNKSQQRSMEMCIREVENGRRLSESLRQTSLFPPLALQLIRMGEANGILDYSCQVLALHYTKRAEQIGQLRNALAYPLFICLAAFCTLLVAVLFVIPVFAKLFEQTVSVLPWPTRFLLQSSQIFSEYCYFFAVGIVIIAIGGICFFSSNRGQAWGEQWAWQCPVVRSLYRDYHWQRIFSLLSVLLSGGTPLLDAVVELADIGSSVRISSQLALVQKNLQNGLALSVSIEDAGLSSPFIGQMLHIGEKTGDMEKSLERIGKFYEKELEIKLVRFQSLAEPIVICILGLVTAFVVFGIMLPIFDMVTVGIQI